MFPWYSAQQPILWWSPDPRLVLPVAEFRVTRSLRKTLRAVARDPQNPQFQVLLATGVKP